VFASVVMVLVAFAESLGVGDARSIARLPDGADPDDLVPYEGLVAVWRELMRRFPTEPLGLRYAATWAPEGLGVVGYALRHARDGHEALALALRFTRLIDPFLLVRVERVGDEHVVAIEHEPRVVAMVEPMEMLVLGTARMAMDLLRPSGAARPREIRFRHRARHSPSLYEPVVGADVAVRFEAAFDGIVFASHWLDRPLQGGDPRMGHYLVRHAESMLADVAAEPSFEEKVRAAIEARLASGEADARHVARSLGTSVRSLQRELKTRGTSFSSELDRVRKDRALVLLGRPELTIAEVAFRLGYAEARVFYRSFRRWTGLSPTAFRRAK